MSAQARKAAVAAAVRATGWAKNLGSGAQPSPDEWAVMAVDVSEEFLAVLASNAALTARLDRVERLCGTVIGVHALVVMDTPEDRELHDRAVATFREELAAATATAGAAVPVQVPCLGSCTRDTSHPSGYCAPCRSRGGTLPG